MTRSILLLTCCFVVIAVPRASAQCTCIFTEGTVKEGETACIWSAKGKTLARCEKVQNVTSWRFLDQDCPLQQTLKTQPEIHQNNKAGSAVSNPV
jgi:hypothetical protein